MARLLGGDDSDSPDEEEERPRRSGVFRRRQRRRPEAPAPRRSASLAAVGVPAVLVVTAVTALWISRTKRVEVAPPPRPPSPPALWIDDDANCASLGDNLVPEGDCLPMRDAVAVAQRHDACRFASPVGIQDGGCTSDLRIATLGRPTAG